MFNYAQIDDGHIVVTVASLSGESDSPDMVRIGDYDTSLLGKKYNKDANQFEDVPDGN